MATIALKEVDKVEILTLQDNYIDLAALDGNEVVQRAMPLSGFEFRNSISAEHGFAALVSITEGESVRTVLFDFGFSKNGAYENAKALNADLSSVEMIALSHGHTDHTGGFKSLVGAIGKSGIPMLAHPAAFRENRVIKISEEFKITLPMLLKEEIAAADVALVETSDPYPMLDGALYFLGEIPRNTEFEKGAASFCYQEDGAEKWDAINDDTSLVANVKGKGLVILSGCAHAGIVNTVNYAKKITGIEQLYVVMGGFHLTGVEFAETIKPTAEALKELNPYYVVPTHCTGRHAGIKIQEQMPEQYLLNMSGTRMVFVK
ncbi:MAG: MBL fold metallo-hydrolase [Deltaproteobacteria bacterium]|nr:MBL fold metallo-hydrolase [Deltaproteobacteria bacterium]